MTLGGARECRVLAVNGAELFVETAGSGPAVVLLHAGIADSRMWDDQVAALEGRYRTVRLDMRGFGRSRMVPGPFAHCADVLAVLDALEIENAALIGCSQGGRVALECALTRSDTVSALVLVASALPGFDFAAPPSRLGEAIEAAARRGDLERVNELEVQYWVDGPDAPQGRAPARVRDLVLDMNRIALSTPEDLGSEIALDPPPARRLGELDVPALVVVGDLDTPRTIATASVLSLEIWNARRFEMPGTAHLPSLERPAEFNEAMLSFLDETLGPAGRKGDPGR